MAVEVLFTTTTLLAAAWSVLENAGYRQVAPDRAGLWPAPGARVYEDPYSIDALVAYETWGDLAANWLEAQGALVELISTHFQRADAKAWEGYLVLLTPSVPPRESQLGALEIRSDTTHARKFVITGDDLRSLDDVERALLPLLPLRTGDVEAEERSAIDLLPELLGRRSIPDDTVRAVIAAFLDQQPLVERLHSFLHMEQSA